MLYDSLVPSRAGLQSGSSRDKQNALHLNPRCGDYSETIHSPDTNIGDIGLQDALASKTRCHVS